MKKPGSLWDALYVDRIPPEQTARECDFIAGFMPLAEYPRLLDLACETGRHTLELASRGYTVTGSDINVKALEVAERRAADRRVSASFIAADLRELHHLDGEFDGIILFWQSFGFFDSNAQVGLFSELHRLLRDRGRVILDLFNGLYFMRDVADTGSLEVNDVTVMPESWENNRRLFSEVGYEPDLQFEHHRRIDIFDPHLFTPGEIAGIAANHDLTLIAACSDYSPSVAPTREHDKMQLVFERGR
jgi:SAM-dependent methyltransferase